MAALIEIHSGGKLHIYTPFDTHFVNELKVCVISRQWHPAPDKYWECREADLHVVEALCQRYFGTVTVSDCKASSPVASGPAKPEDLYKDMPEDLGQAYRDLHLLPTAPLEVADAVYKVYVKFTHPDKGGDAAVFQRYADAIAIVRSYLK